MAGDPRSRSTHSRPPSIHRNPPAAWLGLIPTPFLPQACRIYQCLCLGSFSLDWLLFFLSKSLLACHSFQEAISAIFAPLTALSPSPGFDYLSIPALTVLFTTLHDTYYNGHCNDNSICCPPWFNKQTPHRRGHAGCRCLGLCSCLNFSRGKRWEGALWSLLSCCFSFTLETKFNPVRKRSWTLMRNQLLIHSCSYYSYVARFSGYSAILRKMN